MPILALIAIAAVLYALFGLFVAKSSTNDAFLANGIFNGMAGIIPLIIFAFLYRHNATGPVTKQGIINSIIAGLLITIFSVLLVKIFGRGGNLAYVLPMVYGGAIVIGSILGIIFLKESVSALQLGGIIFVIVGIALIAAAKTHTTAG